MSNPAPASNVTLSDSLNNVTTLYQIATALKGLNWSNIAFVQYPTVADPDNPNRVVPDDNAAQTLNTAIQSDQYVQITGGTGVGSVTSSNQPAAFSHVEACGMNFGSLHCPDFLARSTPAMMAANSCSSGSRFTNAFNAASWERLRG